MKKRILIAATATALAALALTGCTTNNTTTKSGTPSPSASSTPSAKADPAMGNSACADGVQSIGASDKTTKASGCDFVDVLGSGNTLTLGDSRELTVEGSKNTVTVSAATTITTVGSDNTVYYDGDEPKHNEMGSGNKVLPVDQKH
ncbi:DUF3060 domain-containing protein [Microbacterium sp. M1A1_1b]